MTLENEFEVSSLEASVICIFLNFISSGYSSLQMEMVVTYCDQRQKNMSYKNTQNSIKKKKKSLTEQRIIVGSEEEQIWLFWHLTEFFSPAPKEQKTRILILAEKEVDDFCGFCSQTTQDSFYLVICVPLKLHFTQSWLIEETEQFIKYSCHTNIRKQPWK